MKRTSFFTFARNVCIFNFCLACLLGDAYAADAPPVHWTYSGDEGPAEWGSLSDDYAACASGKNQSPIDIANPIEAELPQIEFTYHPSQLKIFNTGHTVQLNFEAGSFIKVDNTKFELKQLHFHAPSENRIHGKSFPLEAHLVHSDDAGNLAVIAVMIEKGKESAFLKGPWQHLPAQAGPEQSFNQTLNPATLLPNTKDYFRFSGSLTTPPCTEGVRWLVMKSPQHASAEQIAQFKKIISHPNNRPVQQTNARVVLE